MGPIQPHPSTDTDPIRSLTSTVDGRPATAPTGLSPLRVRSQRPSEAEDDPRRAPNGIGGMELLEQEATMVTKGIATNVT